MSDFPAAHSMDTTWFAVDACGHVGLFKSASSGAVPIDALQGKTLELLDTLGIPLEPRGGCVHDLASRQLLAGGEAEHVLGPGTGDILFIRPERALRGIPPVADRLATAEGVAIRFWRGYDAEFVRSLHADGDCLGCFTDVALSRHGPFPGDLGLFVYEHLAENWISGPYGRLSSPSAPIDVATCHKAVRAGLERVRIEDACFRDVARTQPIDRFRCKVWEDGVLSLDGGTARAFPGREAAYLESLGHGGLDRVAWHTPAGLCLTADAFVERIQAQLEESRSDGTIRLFHATLTIKGRTEPILRELETIVSWKLGAPCERPSNSAVSLLTKWLTDGLPGGRQLMKREFAARIADELAGRAMAQAAFSWGPATPGKRPLEETPWEGMLALVGESTWIIVHVADWESTDKNEGPGAQRSS